MSNQTISPSTISGQNAANRILPCRLSGATSDVLAKLDALRTELVDLAFELECRGQLNAADVAVTTSVRLAELCEEFAADSS